MHLLRAIGSPATAGQISEERARAIHYNVVSFSAATTTVVALVAILQGIVLVALELRAGRYGRSVLGEGSRLVPAAGA